MTYQLTQSQKDELQPFIDQADSAGLDALGAWKPVYEKLFDFLTESTLVGETTVYSPVAGVDHDVWVWIFGAQFTNAGEGLFGDLIRQYTTIQMQIRSGGLPADWESQLNAASNGIAASFISDVLE